MWGTKVTQCVSCSVPVAINKPHRGNDKQQEAMKQEREEITG